MSMTCIVVSGVSFGAIAYLVYCLIQLQSEADKQISESLARAEEAEFIANQNSLELAKYRRAADELIGCGDELDRANVMLLEEEARFQTILDFDSGSYESSESSDKSDISSQEETVDYE